MQNRLFQLLTLLAIAFMFSCDEDLKPVALGSSNVTISGTQTGTINYNEVEFRYLIQQTGSSQSTISINIGKIGATSSILSLILTETDNSTGFEVDEVYAFQPDPNGTLFYNPSFITADNSYTINPVTNEDNWIKLTKIDFTKIAGEFEVNLEDSEGEMVKLTGSFVAIGSTVS